MGPLREAPGGSGKLYTTLDPDRPFFDEVAADVVPLDFYCYEELEWTTLGIEPPFPVSDEAWMVQGLTPGALDGVRGIVRYPACFSAV